MQWILFLIYYAQDYKIALIRKLVPYFLPSCGLITTSQKFYKDCFEIFPIMLALCLMLSETYYAQNYADIIDLGLTTS